MKLATTTNDIVPYLEDKSVAAPIPYMKETGFRHLDMSFYRVVRPGSVWVRPGDDWKREIEQSLEYAAKDGLDFVQSHLPEGEHFKEGEARDALILAVKRCIEACAMLGCPNGVLHAAPVFGGTREDFLRENVAFYRLFEETAEKYGIDILAENSADAWCPEYYANTGADLLALVKACNMPHLHICWDTGHANVQGLDQYDELMTMGEYVHAFHIQDNFGSADSHIMPIVGTTNFDQVLRGMRDLGYKGVFTFEGENAIRRWNVWPHERRKVLESDRLKNPPLALKLKQEAVMYEVGKWMIESYDMIVE